MFTLCTLLCNLNFSFGQTKKTIEEIAQPTLGALSGASTLRHPDWLIPYGKQTEKQKTCMVAKFKCIKLSQQVAQRRISLY